MHKSMSGKARLGFPKAIGDILEKPNIPITKTDLFKSSLVFLAAFFGTHFGLLLFSFSFLQSHNQSPVCRSSENVYMYN